MGSVNNPLIVPITNGARVMNVGDTLIINPTKTVEFNGDQYPVEQYRIQFVDWGQVEVYACIAGWNEWEAL